MVGDVEHDGGVDGPDAGGEITRASSTQRLAMSGEVGRLLAGTGSHRCARDRAFCADLFVLGE
jgi:hypothetical protein